LGIFDPMDFQFWIWLIVIIITLIARANKKKPEQPPVTSDDPDLDGGSESRQPKPISFEDLLREIQGEKALSKPVKAVPPPPAPKEYDFVDYDDDIPDEIQDLEDVDYDVSKDVKAFETYEAAKKQAKSPIKEQANTGRIVRSEHFKEYDLKKKKPTFDFLNELKDPKGFKKAFIMSEILNKKY